MAPSKQVLCCLLLLVAFVYAAPVEEKASDDYLPRSIKQDEESVPETAPTMPPQPSQELNPPPIYTSNIKPVEFQYFVPLDTAAVGETQSYHTYDVVIEGGQKSEGEEEHPRTQFQHDYVDDNEEGNDAVQTANVDAGAPDSYLPDYEALLKKYFGPKSKYVYDKETLGAPGKANRFKRNAADSSSSSYASSSATGGGPGQSYTSTSFGHYDAGFGQSSFPAGVPDIGTGYGYDANQGGFGLMAGGGNFGNNGYQVASSYSSNSGGVGGGILTRMGGFNDDDVSARGGGQSSLSGRGVFAESGSSIDSNGQSTHYVNSGRL